jgi:hypothetical protein
MTNILPSPSLAVSLADKQRELPSPRRREPGPTAAPPDQETQESQESQDHGRP